MQKSKSYQLKIRILHLFSSVVGQHGIVIYTIEFMVEDGDSNKAEMIVAIGYD